MYLNPNRDIDQGAISVHGITNEFLKDKPMFSDIKEELIKFIDGSELVIHNAPFDVGFLEYEFKIAKHKVEISSICKIFDTLVFARKLHPGQKNNLDALCKRYGVDNSSRDFHGALLDARILGDVYLLMTGGQTSFDLAKNNEDKKEISTERKNNGKSPIFRANEEELREHNKLCGKINEASGGRCIWNIPKF